MQSLSNIFQRIIVAPPMFPKVSMKQIELPHIKYQQYRNTFLKSVFIQIEFPVTVKSDEELDKSFDDYTQSFFGIISEDKISHGLCTISKKDMSHSYQFSKNAVIIQISGNNYDSFSDTAIPFIFKLRHFFSKVVEVENVSKVVIRKVNVWDFKRNDNLSPTVTDVQNLLFNGNMVDELNTDHLTEEEANIPGFNKCVFTNGENTITVRTALIPPVKPDEFFHQILDTEIVRSDNLISIGLADLLMDMNSVLYYCYHWCVNQYVINLMNQDN